MFAYRKKEFSSKTMVLITGGNGGTVPPIKTQTPQRDKKNNLVKKAVPPNYEGVIHTLSKTTPILSKKTFFSDCKTKSHFIRKI